LVDFLMNQQTLAFHKEQVKLIVQIFFDHNIILLVMS